MVIVTTILLPCLINASLLFGGQVASEDLKSFQVAVDIPMEKKFTEVAGTTSLGDFSIMSQEDEFWIKGISECSGGFVEFRDVVKIKGISISDPSAKESTNDSKAARNDCYFIGSRLKFWAALLLGGFVGMVIAMLILQSIFYLKFHT
jgi:hypothetical protein